MDTKKKSKITSLSISIILIIVLSVIFFNIRENYLYTNRDRLIIFCYQTNISGSDGAKWAEHLKTQFTDVPDFEVSVYETKSAGNDSITITTENGWSQIVTRLGAGEGDILLVDNQIFYTVLLENDMLVSLEGNFENPVTDKNGTVLGVDVTEITVDGLLNYDTSQYVGKGQKLPIKPLENVSFEYNGFNYPPRIIAVIIKSSDRIEQSQNILNSVFGEDING